MKAVGYVRISNAEQSHTSIEDQQIRITEYCTRNNIPLAKIFIDRGRSAFTFDRPEWKDLESYLKKNKDVKFIIVKHIDRFSRAKLLDALIKIDEIENKLHVKIVSIEDPIGQNKEDLGVQLMQTIKLLFANNERSRIIERVTDGIYRSQMQGRYLHQAPEGYLNSKDHEGKPLLIIDETKAPIIRDIFNWYLKGKGIVEIVKLARDKGLKKKGNSAIQELLSNPVYAGLVKVKAHRGSPGKVVKGIHAPIVSEQTYWLAKQKLSGTVKKTHSNEDVPLKGVIKCCCGHKMTAGNSKGRNGTYYWYYICWNKECKYFKKHNSAVKVEKQLAEILDVLSFPEERIEWYRSKILESIEQKYANKGGSIMRVKLELQKVQQKIDATQEKYLLQPDISPEVYSKVMTDLKVQEGRYQEQLAKLSTDIQVHMQAIDDVLPRLKNVKEDFYSKPVYRQHLFLNTLFRESIMYCEGVYRTTYIDRLFADKTLILKEKGLLILEQPAKNMDQSPFGGVDRSLFETFEVWAEVFAA
jgi:site-specific DNA recombinase